MGQATTITVVVGSALLALPFLTGGVVVLLAVLGVVHPLLAFAVVKWIAVTVGGTVMGALVLFGKAFVEGLGQNASEQLIAGIAALPLLSQGFLGQSPGPQSRSQHDGRQQSPEVKGRAHDDRSE